MCELLGVTSKKKKPMKELLKTFFSHSIEHRNGWGLVLLDENEEKPFVHKEARRALDSSYLQDQLKGEIATAKCIAHIRKATIGDISLCNTHPFLRKDASGRIWVLAHNGTIFESEELLPFQYEQDGHTDSERILYYIVYRIDQQIRETGSPLSEEERIHIVEKSIHTIAPGNKVNLMLYDGDLFYVHKNEVGTLFEKDDEEGSIFCTVPLEQSGWHETPLNRLMVYRNGDLVYTGKEHHNTYIHSEEQMKLVYLAYAGL